MATVTAGEGHTDGVTVSKPEMCDGVLTLSGYVTSLSAFNGLPGTGFDFDGRYWIIKPVTKPRNAGQLLEGSIEAYSYALVTGPA